MASEDARLTPISLEAIVARCQTMSPQFGYDLAEAWFQARQNQADQPVSAKTMLGSIWQEIAAQHRGVPDNEAEKQVRARAAASAAAAGQTQAVRDGQRLALKAMNQLRWTSAEREGVRVAPHWWEGYATEGASDGWPEVRNAARVAVEDAVSAAVLGDVLSPDSYRELASPWQTAIGQADLALAGARAASERRAVLEAGEAVEIVGRFERVRDRYLSALAAPVTALDDVPDIIREAFEVLPPVPPGPDRWRRELEREALLVDLAGFVSEQAVEDIATYAAWQAAPKLNQLGPVEEGRARAAREALSVERMKAGGSDVQLATRGNARTYLAVRIGDGIELLRRSSEAKQNTVGLFLTPALWLIVGVTVIAIVAMQDGPVLPLGIGIAIGVPVMAIFGIVMARLWHLLWWGATPSHRWYRAANAAINTLWFGLAIGGPIGLAWLVSGG